MLGEQGTERPVHLFCSIQFLDSHGMDQIEITFKQCLYGLTRVNLYAQRTFPDSQSSSFITWHFPSNVFWVRTFDYHVTVWSTINTKKQPNPIGESMFFLCVFVLYCVFFCTGHFVIVPLNLTCLHCLPHSCFVHLFNLYSYFW